VTNAGMSVMLYRWCSCRGVNSEQKMKQTGCRRTKHTHRPGTPFSSTPPSSRRPSSSGQHGEGCASLCDAQDRAAELAWVYVQQRLEDPGVMFDACLSCVRAAISGGDVALDFEIASFPPKVSYIPYKHRLPS